MKKRRAKRKPSRFDRIEGHLAKLSEVYEELTELPALMAEMSADKSRLGFLTARNSVLEGDNAGLLALRREHEGTIAELRGALREAEDRLDD